MLRRLWPAVLRGRRFGVLGLGRLEQEVARIGAAFGMEVQAWSSNLTAARAAAEGLRLAGRDELFLTSDVVTVHLALAETTRGLIAAKEITLMRRTAFLVNTARGAIVDEAARVAALRAGRIAGACLDARETGPLPANHSFRGLRNVVLTPHLGHFTKGILESFYGEAVRLIETFLDGGPARLVARAPNV